MCGRLSEKVETKMAKRGRPTKQHDAKTTGYRIRMTETEMQQLDELQQLCDTSKAEVIRHALACYYNKTIKKKKKEQNDECCT